MIHHRFNTIIAHTLKWEGGYVNDPDDPGGETNYGISKRSYPHVDIASLTEQEAIDIYYNDYWLPGPFTKIQSFRICARLFDLSVNMGLSRASKLLQVAINKPGLHIDGIVGPITLEALHAVPDEGLVYDRLIDRAESFYRKLQKPKYLNGWLNRLHAEIPTPIPISEDEAVMFHGHYLDDIERLRELRLRLNDDESTVYKLTNET